jgi:hypothetical protein
MAQMRSDNYQSPHMEDDVEDSNSTLTEDNNDVTDNEAHVPTSNGNDNGGGSGNDSNIGNIGGGNNDLGDINGGDGDDDGDDGDGGDGGGGGDEDDIENTIQNEIQPMINHIIQQGQHGNSLAASLPDFLVDFLNSYLSNSTTIAVFQSLQQAYQRLGNAVHIIRQFYNDQTAALRKWKKENPKMFWFIVALVVLGCTAGGVAGAVTLAGFSSSGVVAGSAAAAWQASIGNVAAASLFAFLQSVTATGVIWIPFTVCSTAAGMVASGSVLWNKVKRWLGSGSGV